MDWIFENLRVVILVIVIAVWIMRAIAANKTKDAPPPGPQQSAEDPADAERTRQIQEEIRRRILARQRGEVLTPAPAPASVPTPPPLPVTPPVRQDYDEDEDPNYSGEGPHVPMPTAAAHRQADAAQAAILEQQRLLAEQLHALRMARAAGGSLAPAAPIQLPAQAMTRIAAHERSCRRELLRDLRSPTSVRRAVLLKEILGAPLALQRGPQIPRR